MSCFPSGPVVPRDPMVLDASGRAVNRDSFHVGIAAHEALVKSTRQLFAPGPLVTLTDDPPRADASLVWKFNHGSLGDTSTQDWFSDPTTELVVRGR